MKTELRFDVAGVRFSDYAKIKNYYPGVEVKLIPEPTNKFDDKAVRVEYAGVKIGYVPKKGVFQEAIHESLIAGLEIKAKLISYNKNNPSWMLFVVGVEIDKPEFDIIEETGKMIEEDEYADDNKN